VRSNQYQFEYHVGVLVLTMIDDDDAVFAAMRAGARGHLLKGSEHAEILHAIRAVGAGEAVFGPAIARRLIDYFASSPSGLPQAFPQLTQREREGLELIAQGESNTAIAHPTHAQPEDRAQPRFEHLQQAAGRGSRARDRQSA
jgi:DNA-binding NarL/FixJ family response regulator